MAGNGDSGGHRLSELSLLSSEADGQMQRALKGLHRAFLSRQTELRRVVRAFGGAQAALERRRLRLQDELAHNERMAERATRRGDSEEAAYRAAQASHLSHELAAVEADLRARADKGCREVNRDLLSTVFNEAVDDFAAQLVTEMRATSERVAEREIRELTATQSLQLSGKTDESSQAFHG